MRKIIPLIIIIVSTLLLAACASGEQDHPVELTLMTHDDDRRLVNCSLALKRTTTLKQEEAVEVLADLGLLAVQQYGRGVCSVREPAHEGTLPVDVGHHIKDAFEHGLVGLPDAEAVTVPDQHPHPVVLLILAELGYAPLE